MLNHNSKNNGVNGTGTRCKGPSPGRCSPAQQRGPGRHLATARMRWNKEVNKVVMECFYRSKPFDEEGKPIRWIGKLGIPFNVGVMQKTALLGTARILKKVLEM